MKTKRMARLWLIATSCLVLVFCEKQEAPATQAQTTGSAEAQAESQTPVKNSAVVSNRTPAEYEYEFGNMQQVPGRVTAVTVTPKRGKSPGEVTNVRYDGRREIPQREGNFVITFDVLPADGWDGTRGLYAGKLAIAFPTPQAGDYVFGNMLQVETEGVTAVGITVKEGKSPAAVTNIRYGGREEVPQAAGIYAVTFDVPAAEGWNGADGLSAGDLRISPRQSPAEDFAVIYGALVSYTGNEEDVVIPPDLGITEITDDAFARNAGIVSVKVPSGVQSICFWAFNNCTNLRSVSLPETVISIGDRAFESTALDSVDIPSGVTGIGYAVFRKSKLASVNIPPGVTSIGDSAFALCQNLASVTIPPGVTGIGDSAFYWCRNLTSVAIPSSVTGIGNAAFSDCESLVSVEMAYGVTQIGAYAFAFCHNLASVTIPSSVTTINNNAFTGCDGLTSVIIPPSVTSIGSSAFSSCDNLTSVTMPDTVKSIGGDIFEQCPGLKQITVIQTGAGMDASFFRERLSGFEVVFK